MIEPNDSDLDGDDLMVIKLNGESIDSDGQFAMTLSSGMAVMINMDGDYTYDPNGKFESSDVATRVLIPVQVCDTSRS